MVSRSPTVLDMLLDQADKQPDAACLVVPREGEPDVTVTFSELASRVGTAAGRFRQMGVHPGDHVLLVLPNRVEFFDAFFGVIAAGAVPVPLSQPLHVKSLGPFAEFVRAVEAITRSSELITTAKIAKPLKDDLHGVRSRIKVHAVDDASQSGDDHLFATPRETAFVQFTSGSTRSPQGVQVLHHNVLANTKAVIDAFGIGSEAVSVSWLPLYHDMGLIGTLSALRAGATCVVLTPMGFLMRPVSWLRALSDKRGTHTAVPGFSLDVCTRRVRDDDVGGLDLRSVHALILGGEANSAKSIREFVRKFADTGLRPTALCPGYGLAEATLLVSASRPGEACRAVKVGPNGQRRASPIIGAGDEDLAVDWVSCGRPIEDHRVTIADADLRPVAPGVEGEILFEGPSVTPAYLNDARATAAQYVTVQGRRVLRTGDLGFVYDGDLYVTGRVKDVVIINGRNIHPSDVEVAVLGDSSIAAVGAVAFGVFRDEAEQLVVLVELDAAARRRALAPQVAAEHCQAIARLVVAEFGVSPHDIVIADSPGEIPRTSSGKVRRTVARDAYLSRSAGVVNEARPIA